ncbi:putative 50S ribosomal protein L33 [Plasmodium gaboni]|uniref:Putative 50S ribosomal protein L33 n=2 Tax=Plasmodium (Laverania) TaxID=418107 RepID=A0A151LWJ2_9APIC|nr:putative 50S ribosomal protein L33 [Plasmodium gaboni]KYO03537.1 putative 50S ribosomal protein L33 [Plasmodium gaboni]
MLFLSNVLFRCKSKRVHINLISSCASNYIYSTYISPSKSKYRLSLRKHDPVVNRHVMFYQKHIKAKSKKKWKNKNLRPLLKRVEKSYLYGKFNKLIDNTYRSLPRMS